MSNTDMDYSDRSGVFSFYLTKCFDYLTEMIKCIINNMGEFMGSKLVEHTGEIYTEAALEELSGFKTCKCCKIVKSLSAFDPVTRKVKRRDIISQALKSYCRTCCVEDSKRYYRKIVEKKRAYQREYFKKNKDKLRATKTACGANYRAKKSKATPPWLTKEDRAEMRLIFKERERLSALHNTGYHVDHIVPLNGKVVCGLHVPWNLRVIPEMDNLYKSCDLDHDLLAKLYINYHQTEVTAELLHLLE